MAETETAPSNARVRFSKRASSDGVIDLLMRARDMRDKGSISAAEYDKLEAKAKRAASA